MTMPKKKARCNLLCVVSVMRNRSDSVSQTTETSWRPIRLYGSHTHANSQRRQIGTDFFTDTQCICTHENGPLGTDLWYSN